MSEAYIIDGLRTAIGSFGGTLAPLGAADLAVPVIKRLLEKNGIKPENVDEVLMGCVLQAGLGQNVARQAALKSGIPHEKTALTVNMVCGSGLRAVALAAQAIKAEDEQIVVAGGMESMSNAPHILPNSRVGNKMGNIQMVDSMVNDGLWDIFNNYHMGVTAENLVSKYGLTREDLDNFAAESQQKTEKANTAGKFKDEIVPIILPQKKGDPIVFDTDEFPRAGTTAEKLGKLK
ncbi:MAG: acetyl-CoA C-acyltransferase, partial [Elusimicrobiaceae bacterium]